MKMSRNCTFLKKMGDYNFLMRAVQLLYSLHHLIRCVDYRSNEET